MHAAHCLRLAAFLLLLVPVFAAPSTRAEDGRPFAAPAPDEIARRGAAVEKHFSRLGFDATFGAVEAGATAEGLVLRNVRFTPAGTDRTHTIERIDIRRVDWGDPEHPRYASFSVRGLTVPAASLGSLAATLGLSSLTVHLDLDYRFDEAKRTVEIAQGVLDAVELGEARFRLTIADLTHADYRNFVAKERRGADYEAAAGRIAMATLAGASLSFKDRSLIERLVRNRAKAKGIAEDAAKDELIRFLSEEQRTADDPSLRALLDAAAKFIAKPGEIAIAANPPPGVSLLMLSILFRNPAVLGLTVSVN